MFMPHFGAYYEHILVRDDVGLESASHELLDFIIFH